MTEQRLESISDNDLMFLVKEGDLDKLGPLYERYKKVLFAFFYRMNYDKELSEDLVQNVFIRILKYRTTFKGKGEFRIWMFHIARNVNHEHYRRNSKLGSADKLRNVHHLISDFSEIEETKKKEDDLALLDRAITLLNEDKREIIMLSKIENIKYSDIGEILNCSENTVKIKVFRAMKELKSVYEKIKDHYE